MKKCLIILICHKFFCLLHFFFKLVSRSGNLFYCILYKVYYLFNLCIYYKAFILTAKEKLRLLPPLTISYEDIDRGLEILAELLK